MNRLTTSVLCILLAAFVMSACDFLDPTDVRNPQTTESSLREGGTGATVPFLVGVQEAFSSAVEDIAYFTDVVSDNYDNVATFISPQADLPRSMVPQDLTLNGGGGPYFEVQELRALADFTLTGVIPNDAEATPVQLAEVTFFRGMANLISAENFGGVPIVEDGPVVPPSQLLQLAVDDFKSALSTSQHEGFATRIHIVLARAYRDMGDVAMAEAEANAALASGPADFLFNAEYDAENNTNTAYVFAVARNLNDVQPLPRLDYLDPKYTVEDAPIPVAKMEEAHLILAEVELSKGNAAAAAGHLADAIALAKTRPVVPFLDPDPRPDNTTGSTRPQSGTVQASPSAPAIAGLILPRGGNLVQVPSVSGTSLDEATVRGLTDPVQLFYDLYLARQEIFFFEGRRMNDLGIRLPMMEREIETNDTINAGDPGTVVIVPDFIPPGDELDAFTFDGANTVIKFDMNQVLTDNRFSPFNMPF
ncbi:MAG: hypothetical protein D6743_08070 [Calditrichaeota bacterium]|nr:MAG: hypothetical protein D6743_08070 [Calditrichota bacterium]